VNIRSSNRDKDFLNWIRPSLSKLSRSFHIWCTFLYSEI